GLAGISVQPRPERIPLSFAQERLWFIDKLEGSVAYHMPLVLRMQGQVNVAALTYALQEVVNRHEILRTVIGEQEGKASQRVLEPDGFQLGLEAGESCAKDAVALRAYIDQLIGVRFDLSVDYSLRAHLIRLGEQEWILVLVVHHIASDGWSNAILVKELVNGYKAYREGSTLSLAALPVQYADYAIWQRRHIRGEVLEKKLGYWQERLTGLEPLHLPTDYVRPLLQSSRGASLSFRLDVELTGGLQRLSLQEDSTLFMTLLAVFKVLMYKYSGQEDIAVGSVLAGRQQTETESLIGYFVNTLVLRTDLGNNPPFITLLQRIRDTTLGAYEHQEVPFEKVVESLVTKRDTGRNALFDVLFVLQHKTGELIGRNSLPGLDLIQEKADLLTSKFDLTYTLTEEDEEWTGTVEYCTDLYREETITRMVTHYKELLQNVVRAPEQRIGDLQMLTQEEREQLQEEFNPEKAVFSEDRTILELFEEQVAMAPDSVALVFEEEELTYRELDKRSNQLGHYLRKAGLKKESPVVICTVRNLEMVVGIWGILKAGGAYVPIDPAYPADRIRYILEDTGAGIILTSKACSSGLPSDHPAVQVYLDEDWEKISREPVTKITNNIMANHLAYVIYTSGSTGRPKGVMIEHRNVSSFLQWCRKEFADSPFEIVYAATSICFDLSVFELLYPVIQGKRIRLLEDGLTAGKYLPGDSQVLLNTVPGVLQFLLREKIDLGNISVLNIAGEPIPPDVQLRLAINKTEVRNLYGPTETTTYSTCYRIKTKEPALIGRPIANTYLCIRGIGGALSPIGVPGELCIGGSGVARGYLNQPELTAESFRAGENGGGGERVLYRTGDLCRWRPDGNIEYLGRRDEQLKIRGYRIEPGEIERVLEQSGLVYRSAVVAHTDNLGNKRLVGYAVPKENIDRDDILFFLQSRLPDYMVPALLIMLEKLPVTPNGKIDRKSLPAPDSTAMMNGFAAPRSKQEKELAGIWEELLDVKQVGIHDNFFELGGDSIITIQVVSRARRLGYNLQPKDLFRYQQIEGLAIALESRSLAEGDLSADLSLGYGPDGEITKEELDRFLDDIAGTEKNSVERKTRRDRVEGVFGLSSLQKGMLFHGLYEERTDTYITQLSCGISSLDKAAFQKSWSQLLKRHSILRSAFYYDVFSMPVQVAYRDISMSVGEEDYRSMTPEEQEEAILAYEDADRRKGFDVKQAPLMRIRLLRLGEDRYRMVWTFHHLLLDGWSVPVLLEELLDYYEELIAATESRNADLPDRPADVFGKYIQFLERRDIEKEKNYWTSYLAGLSGECLLPFIGSTNERNKGNGDYKEEILKLPPDFAARIIRFAKNSRLTLNTVMQGVWAFLLYRYTGNRDIVYGVTVSGRPGEMAGVEKMVGMFINTLVFRSTLDEDQGLLTFLQKIQEEQSAAREYQYAGLSDIQRWMGWRGDMFDSLLVFENYPVSKIFASRLGSLDITNVELKGRNNYPLGINITAGETIMIRFRYNTQLLPGRYVNAIRGHFEQVLDQLTDESLPLQLVKDLELLTPAEKKQLIGIGYAQEKYPENKTMVELFEEQAILNPDGIALVFEEKELTYRELDLLSNQLGHYLKSQGVRAEDLVPVCMERSWEMIVCVLGILKAGGAFVPIDPAFPAGRIRFMLEDTGARIVLSSMSCRSGIPGGDFEVITLDEAWADIIREQETKPLAESDPHHPIYVIYTSGSTGHPKGVLIEHHSLVDHIYGVIAGADLKNCRSFALVASLVADAGYSLLFSSFVLGGTVHILSEALLSESRKMRAYLEEKAIDCLKIVPSLWISYIDEGKMPLPEKVLIFGGEAFSPVIIGHLKHSAYKGVVYNHYGPTEATIGKCIYKVDFSKPSPIIPIGKPFSNTQVYIAGQADRLQPVGTAGELFLGGVGIARGYLNRPELTAYRFIVNPFDGRTSLRLYRTGDLCRWLPDGNIEYLGRKDDQLKIRGYRIEPGEIERVLEKSGLIQQGIVSAVSDRQGNKRLAAYIVARGEFNKKEIADFLKSQLPDYMIPAFFIELDHMPLTYNGKIDRKALPDPEPGELQGTVYAVPRNITEQNLAGIWEELLDVKKAGIYDNFFELGGDSIISIQVVSRARRLGMETLQVGDLFKHQTIAALSAILDIRSSGTGKLSGNPEDAPEGKCGLLPVQQAFLDHENGSGSHFNQSVLLGVKKTVTAEALGEALEGLRQLHDALRFRYHRTAGGWEQEYMPYTGSSMGSLIVETITGSGNALETSLAERGEHYQGSLRLEEGDLMRAVLLSTPAEEPFNRLLIVIHHLVVDGVSWRILLEDLEWLLENGDWRIRGGLNKKSPSPGNIKKGFSYREWYETLEQYGRSERLRGQLSYWEKVAGSYLPLPLDRPDPGPVLRKDTRSCRVRLNREQTRLLLQEAPGVYHTEINDLLLTALGSLLCRWSKRQEVVIGLEGHGRENIGDVDTSRTVGWFTSIYPVLIEIPVGMSEGSLIKNVKEQLRKVADKGIGYGVLKYIRREKSLQGRVPWDIVFNYLGQLDNVLGRSKWFREAGEEMGDTVGEEIPVAEKLSVNGKVQVGELVLDWSYSSLHYDEQTVRALADDYMRELEKLIGHCVKKGRHGHEHTPSDYGLGGEVTFEELDKFLEGEPGRDLVEGVYRLSSLQKGMLFHGLYDGQAGAYVEQFSCEVTRLDKPAFEKSWSYLLKRHSILRSAFYYDVFSIPVQVVFKEIKMPLYESDYRYMTSEEQTEAILAYEEADRRKGFDFKLAPLMRIGLLRLAEDRYRMLWTHHHILIDGWSIPVLMEELLKYYEELVTGKDKEGKTPPEDRYEDYIRYIESRDNEKAAAYWRNYLAGITEGSLLPFIEPTAARNKGLGIFKESLIQIGEAGTGRIVWYAQKHRLTVNTVMQGVWAYLLYRYTDNPDVVYGVTVSGRPEDLPQVEKRVGMYINTIPFHARLTEDQDILSWLEGIQQDQGLCREYQYTGLNDIQRWLDIPGDLFDSLLVFENYPVSQLIAARDWALQVSDVRIHDQSNFPLGINIAAGKTITIRFRYNAHLLSERDITQMQGHFREVLEQLTESDLVRNKIKDIRLMSLPERRQILLAFNDTSTVFPPAQTVVELFGEQVRHFPDYVAVVFEESRLTYGELDVQSNQLAHFLRKKGVGSETLVAVCLGRSPEMIIGILGILKAGGAYLPLDPAYPAERIRFMVEDADAKVIVSNRKIISNIQIRKDCSVVLLDEDGPAIRKGPEYHLQTVPKSGQAAYVIYTSGSTGRPKGVIVEHGGLVNMVFNHIQFLGLNPGNSILQFASFSFDGSCQEIFNALSSGGKLVIPNKEQILSSSLLIELLKRNKVEVATFPPSYIPAITDEIDDLVDLRYLYAAGEPLTAETAKSVILKGINLVNGYGPTENTVTATLTHNPLRPDGGITIGKPVKNVRIYILDKSGNPSPIGIGGELCIGGLQVARGYLNRPELTAESFMAGPLRGLQENGGGELLAEDVTHGLAEGGWE
ncbi:amino acid adenylation domain-containing protein, partial [Flavitalea flava]